MTHLIRFLTHSSGIKIPYFIEQEKVWLAATEAAKLLNYAKPQGAIKRHVSSSNQKKFCEFNLGVRISGIQSNRIFINFEGLQQLLQQNRSHPLATDWSTQNSFLKEITDEKSNGTQQFSFSTLEEIPETVVKPLSSNGYVYLLKWNQFGKVGKTRSLRNRKQTLQQKFKDAELFWFCFCENIDFLEREILEKLQHLGALVKTDESTEIFDPTIISFDAVRHEIQRLADEINSQSPAKTEKFSVQSEYLNWAATVIQPLEGFAKQNPQAYVQFIEKLLEGFEKI